MSGIVNVTTKDGKEKFHLKIQYESPMLNNSPYHEKNWILNSNIVDGMTSEQKEEYKDAVVDSLGNSAYEHIGVLDSKYKDKRNKVK